MRVVAKRGRWHVYTHDAITITADAYETILLGTAEAPSPQGQVCRSAQAACQQRLDELFPDMASRPESPEPPAKLTPEEIQQQLNEAFAGVLLNGGTPRTPPEPRIESPGPSLSSEELQQHLNEHFRQFSPAAWADPVSPPNSIAVQGRQSRHRGAFAPSTLRRAGQEPVQDRQERRRGRVASFAKAGRWRTVVAGCAVHRRPRADARLVAERERLHGKHGKSEGDARRPRVCGAGAGSPSGARAHRRIACVAAG
jgi:hypothetical protein